MQKIRMAALAGALAAAAICLAAVIGGENTVDERPKVVEAPPAEDTEAPYHVRLTEEGLAVYFGGRRTGEPDETVRIDTGLLTGEDRLRLGAGMDLEVREEYLMLLESLTAG
ncbi:MAG: hypothetical protein J6S59_07205 [Clostridia bacterium]|nr:hypothetical protein [Clostridia bacterium]